MGAVLNHLRTKNRTVRRRRCWTGDRRRLPCEEFLDEESCCGVEPVPENIFDRREDLGRSVEARDAREQPDIVLVFPHAVGEHFER